MKEVKYMARPTKLTPELQETICEIIGKGNSITTACHAVGIADTTFYEWKQKGEHEPDSLHGEFLCALNKAEADAKQELLQYVKDAAPHSWQASMTILERRWPQEFGRRDRIEVHAKIGPAVEIEMCDQPVRTVEQVEGGKNRTGV